MLNYQRVILTILYPYSKLRFPDVFPISRGHRFLRAGAVAGTANFAAARQQDIGWGTLENRGLHCCRKWWSTVISWGLRVFNGGLMVI